MLSELGNDASQNHFTSNTAKPVDIFDPFATLEGGGGDANNLLSDWSNFTAAPPTMSTVSPQSKQPELTNKDPFANLGNLVVSNY